MASATKPLPPSLTPWSKLACVRTLKGHRGPINVIRFNSTGKYALSAGTDKCVRLWNPHRDAPGGWGGGPGGGGTRAADVGDAAGMRSRAPFRGEGEEDTGALMIKEYRSHGYEVADVCVCADNSRFASVGGDKCAFLWDTASGNVIRRIFGHEHRLTCVEFNEEATVLVTGSFDKSVRAWDLRASSRAAIQVMADFRDNVTRVITTRTEIIASSMDGTVRTFDLRAGRAITDEFPVAVSDLALSNDGNCVLAANPGSTARLSLLEKHAGGVLNRYAGHVNSLYGLRASFSADDAVVLSGSEDGNLVAWDLVDSAQPVRLAAHKRVVSSVSVFPRADVVMLLTASFDGTAKLWAPEGADYAIT